MNKFKRNEVNIIKPIVDFLWIHTEFTKPSMKTHPCRRNEPTLMAIAYPNLQHPT